MNSILERKKRKPAKSFTLFTILSHQQLHQYERIVVFQQNSYGRAPYLVYFENQYKKLPPFIVTY